MILGIDAGNYETKVCANDGVQGFLSDIGEYRERKFDDVFGNDDIIWEYDGQRGYAGTLAKYESEFGGTIKGTSKANSDAVLRVLIATHLHGSKVNDIIVGQPIEMHINDEKLKIKEDLKGNHSMSINGETKTFTINNIEVAPEGMSALLSNPHKGLVRVVDIGSGTTNFGTLFDLKRIDRDSFTEQIGMETIKTYDMSEMAMKIYRTVSGKWGKDDNIFVTGGGADHLHGYLIKHLPNCKVLKPRIGNKLFNTRYANAIGFYNIAKGLFSNGSY